ncbi:histidinol-phosphate transaminase [Pantoea sp. B65]|uniref:histidinol-phosphate transaminase n=1 Tax=Pantoea sp. B65 TaxID=2813359 RepID=UPI0039B42A7F
MLSNTLHSLARKDVLELGVYNAGLSDEAVRKTWQVETISRLASNENPLGASARVLEALNHSNQRSAIYPDAASSELRAALAAQTAIAADCIAIGNGSEELLKLLCLAFVNRGDRVVTLLPSFGLHQIYPQLMGAQVDLVAVNQQMEYDLPAWESALAAPAKLVIFSNPSNPVGCMLDRRGFQRLIDAAPQNALLVVDEAYFEYCAQREDYPDSLTLLRQQSRPWIVLRTFSKAYGLAGLRIGYGLASDPLLVDLLNRVRTPFNINRAAQAAALVALDDQQHVRDSAAWVVEQRHWLAAELKPLVRQIAPSEANFLFFRVAGDGAELAKKLLAFGIIVKPWLEPGYRDWVRVSIGSAADNQRFITALRQIL